MNTNKRRYFVGRNLTRHEAETIARRKNRLEKGGDYRGFKYNPKNGFAVMI